MAQRKTAILAIDQGTTSSRAVVFTGTYEVIAVAQREFQQIYPEPGWVEHDPEVIWATVRATAREALAAADKAGYAVAAIGITNQRETTLVWDRKTGEPVHNAIVWQDRRTAQTCAALREAGHADRVREKTGLVLDPYFSATKIAWILDHADGARARAEAGELVFGTVDTWLIWRLTGGAVHATDATNASRTSLFNIRTNAWDEALLSLFGVPAAMLPEVRDSAGDFGVSEAAVLGRALPIRGVAGDQQSAAIGQACLVPGEMKSTYGTGAFLLINTGSDPVLSQNQLLTTIAWRIGGETVYALEGSILSAGATVQWLRDGLGLIAKASEIEALAAAADPDSGVCLVPAFTGLGAPYWDPDARGAIVGLTRGSGRAEIARAALDSTVHQTCDLLDAIAADGVAATRLRVDGGMTANNALMQRLADLTGIEVVRPVQSEATAWGAAFLAGLGAGIFASLEDGRRLWAQDRSFTPDIAAGARDAGRAAWRTAVERVRTG
ncbi:glycerol kinase GlpK [Maricaulis virginensis]|uniref:Glycerol kinase n=1 Tax=Maricaulis virginensis TaxID=144022 RepID=A0A9W6IMW9_9PROT|nr:glycerol kinase GlpK [Maricaulis virginensis]GLK51876.1 glycerol kinase [Maricaulis virginensis]